MKSYEYMFTGYVPALKGEFPNFRFATYHGALLYLSEFIKSYGDDIVNLRLIRTEWGGEDSVIQFGGKVMATKLEDMIALLDSADENDVPVDGAYDVYTVYYENGDTYEFWNLDSAIRQININDFDEFELTKWSCAIDPVFTLIQEYENVLAHNKKELRGL